MSQFTQYSQFLLNRHWRILFIMCSVVIDFMTIAASGAVTYALRYYFFDLPYLSYGLAVFSTFYFACVFLVIASVLGLYRASFQTTVAHQNMLAAKAYLLAIPTVLASYFLFRYFELSRSFLILLFVISPIVFALGRVLLNKFLLAMRKYRFGLYRALLVNDDHSGPFFFHKFDVLSEMGYEIVNVVAMNGMKERLEKESPFPVAHCETWVELKSVIQSQMIDYVVVPSMEFKSDTFSDLIHACRDTNAKLKILSKESQELLRFPFVTDIAGILLYAFPRRKIEFMKHVIKRSFDIFGSIVAITLFSPIFILASLAIFLEDGLPVFYRQRRALAKGHKEFDILKFRTMVKDAEQKQNELYEKNQTSGGLFLLKEDPRLLRVGKILRKFSIDELPQLFNVLKGDMSLVGPRPLSLADLENIAPQNRLGGYYELRAKALAGMTGLWQVSGRREIDFKEMVLLDLYYIENQSILFDIEILFKTIPVVLFGKGGY